MRELNIKLIAIAIRRLGFKEKKIERERERDNKI